MYDGKNIHRIRFLSIALSAKNYNMADYMDVLVLSKENVGGHLIMLDLIVRN